MEDKRKIDNDGITYYELNIWLSDLTKEQHDNILPMIAAIKNIADAEKRIEKQKEFDENHLCIYRIKK